MVALLSTRQFDYYSWLMKAYVRFVGGAINLLERIFFWPSVRSFLKGTKMMSSSDLNNVIIVDVGTNRGQCTGLFLKWFPRAIVYGFEPLPNAFLIAKKKLADRAHLFNLGVSNISGVQTFWESRLDENSTFNLPNLESNYHKVKSKILLSAKAKVYKPLSVETITLDDFCYREKIASINFLKVDTEGHELEILKGSTHLLANQLIGIIQIERHETGLRSSKGLVDQSFTEVESLLNAFSYFRVKEISHVFARIYDVFYVQKRR